MTRVPRRHGDRHGERKDTSTKISNNTSLYEVGSGPNSKIYMNYKGRVYPIRLGIEKSHFVAFSCL